MRDRAASGDAARPGSSGSPRRRSGALGGPIGAVLGRRRGTAVVRDACEVEDAAARGAILGRETRLAEMAFAGKVIFLRVAARAFRQTGRMLAICFELRRLFEKSIQASDLTCAVYDELTIGRLAE
jgi:hypothetical protein